MTTFGRWLRTTKQPTTRKSRSRRVNSSKFLSSLMEVHDGEFACCWLKEWIQQKGGRLITTLNVPKNAIRERNDIRISRSPVAKVSAKNAKLETSCDVLYPSVNRPTFHCLLRAIGISLLKESKLRSFCNFILENYTENVNGTTFKYCYVCFCIVMNSLQDFLHRTTNMSDFARVRVTKACLTNGLYFFRVKTERKLQICTEWQSFVEFSTSLLLLLICSLLRTTAESRMFN